MFFMEASRSALPLGAIMMELMGCLEGSLNRILPFCRSLYIVRYLGSHSDVVAVSDEF